MKSFYDDLLFHYKMISYDDLKTNMSSKDYKLLTSDIDSVDYAGSILDHIELNLNKLYDKSLYKNTLYLLIYFWKNTSMPYFSDVELHIIIINNNKYYYINYIHKEDVFSVDNYSYDEQSAQIKEYDNWKDLITSLSDTDSSRLYISNGYEIIK